MKKPAILLTTLALMLAACNDTTQTTTETTTDAGETTTQTTETTETTETATPEATNAVTEGGGSKTGKENYVYMASSDLPTLDPGNTYDTASGAVLENVYETLVAYKGSSLTDLEGLLATEWEANADGTEYRFTLRPDVKFHSGNTMTCADAEYTFQRNLVTNSAESGNWFFAESLLGTGANANDDDTVTWERIDNAVQCDGETLVFTLPKTDPAFLSKLAYTGQSIVDSKHAIEIGEWDGTGDTMADWVGVDLSGSALSKDASGTGAYRLASSDATNTTLTAFEDYWGGAPAIKNWVRQIVPEDSSRIQALLSGDADLIDAGSREVVETQIAGQPGISVMDTTTDLSARGLIMNQDLEGSQNIGSGNWGDGVPTNFFADAQMRECFVKAFDSDAYIEQVQRGKGEKMNFLLPKSFLGYDESVPYQSVDLEGAQAACEAAHGGAAWENGFTLNAAIQENAPTLQTAMEILKANIEQMNPKFRVNIVTKPWSEIIDSSNVEAMVYGGWAPDYADPDNFVHTMYHSEGYYAPRTHISDPEIDGWIDEARSTIDEAERKALYSQIANKAAAENYYIILPNAIGIMATPNNVQGRTLETRNQMRAGGWLIRDLSKTE
ncbi:ABC transporter substrate-binding protein [Deinococcus radiophilus]|uniref:ABC transporter substrate-binding protein n=1 Tax=Deinococcus radiophilus TaxID=32062 RepID=UPI001E5E91BD|nr:ABC transporter substrate-binding protein [Deinococcus radiophilus]UFA49471.1 ABC transporter substrate-binding protein [Deinococcus radiophilus]